MEEERERSPPTPLPCKWMHYPSWSKVQRPGVASLSSRVSSSWSGLRNSGLAVVSRDSILKIIVLTDRREERGKGDNVLAAVEV